MKEEDDPIVRLARSEDSCGVIQTTKRTQDNLLVEVTPASVSVSISDD